MARWVSNLALFMLTSGLDFLLAPLIAVVGIREALPARWRCRAGCSWRPA